MLINAIYNIMEQDLKRKYRSINPRMQCTILWNVSILMYLYLCFRSYGIRSET